MADTATVPLTKKGVVHISSELCCTQSRLAGNCLKERSEKARSSFPSDLKRGERKNPLGRGGEARAGRGLSCALALRSAAVLWDSDDLGYSASWILSRLMLRNTKAFCLARGDF